MRKKIAIRTSAMRSCFPCFFPIKEEKLTTPINFNRTESQRPSRTLLQGMGSPDQALEIDNVVTTPNRMEPLEKCKGEILESGDLRLQFDDEDQPVSYVLSKDLVDQLSYFKAQISFMDVQVIQESDLGPEMYSLRDSVLSQFPQGEVIGSDEFKKAIQDYVSENLKSPNLIVNLYKALDYFGYDHFEAFEGLKLFPMVEATIRLEEIFIKIEGDGLSSWFQSDIPTVIKLEKMSKEQLQNNLMILQEYPGPLNKLDLSSNHIHDVEDIGLLGSLTLLTGLKELNLSKNTIEYRGATTLASALTCLTALQSLDLSYNKIGDAGAAALAGALSRLKGLKFLNLYTNSLGGGDIALAPALGGLSDLQELNLGGNDLGAAGATALAGSLSRLIGLQSLDLRNNSIEAAGATALAPALGVLRELRALNLSFNQLGDAGVVPLAGGLSGLSRLQRLKLDNNRIEADGAVALAGVLRLLTGLQDLDLSGNSIGDAGATALAGGLSRLTGLTSLNLNFNQLGDAGVVPLAGGLRGLSGLTTLNLLGQYNSILNSTTITTLASALMHLKALKSVDLAGFIAHDMVIALRTQLSYVNNLKLEYARHELPGARFSD